MKPMIPVINTGLILGVMLSAPVQSQDAIPFDQLSGPLNMFLDGLSNLRGVQLQQEMDERGYILKIHTAGKDPSAIQVTPKGRSLLIKSSQSHRTEHRDDQRSDYRSYSFFSRSGGFKRRISIPWDADVNQMSRTDEPELVTIVLPRRAEATPEQGLAPDRGNGMGSGYDPGRGYGPGAGYYDPGSGFGPAGDPGFGPEGGFGTPPGFPQDPCNCPCGSGYRYGYGPGAGYGQGSGFGGYPGYGMEPGIDPSMGYGPGTAQPDYTPPATGQAEAPDRESGQAVEVPAGQ